MSVSDYIAELQKTKMYQAGLIKFQEYTFKSSIFGLVRALPNVPHADEDRHVIVLEMRGNQPNIFTVLADSRHTISPTSRDADKLLFIFVEMKRRMLRVETPIEGYHLGDGHKISATFQVTYQVADAEQFWKVAKDPLAELETTVIDAAKNYFLNITSNYLINSPAELKQSLEQHIQDTSIKIVKSNLEESIRENCVIAGIEIIKVSADVHLSDTLRDHLSRIHNRIYGSGGHLERRRIDTLIDSDTTFSPYSLRKVIMSLNPGLLENFYTMNWSDAMRQVHEKLVEKKEEYLKAQQEAEIEKIKKLIKTAKEVELDELDVKDLKAKLADKLHQIADRDDSSPMPSDNEFLQLMMGPSSFSSQLTAGTTE